MKFRQMVKKLKNFFIENDTPMNSTDVKLYGMNRGMEYCVSIPTFEKPKQKVREYVPYDYYNKPFTLPATMQKLNGGN